VRREAIARRQQRKRLTRLDVEQAREERRAVEARQTQPVDVRGRRDEREHTPVADRAVIEWNSRRGVHAWWWCASREVSVSNMPAQRKMLCSARCTRRRCM